MFEGPSDLVVLPCSIIPTVTPFVTERLRRFSIGQPTEPMTLGGVYFVRLTDAEHVANWAAYAASVDAGRSSSLDAIEAIGRRLGAHAAEHADVNSVASPMLGTGSGGLAPEPATQSLVRGFLATAPDRAILRLYALDEGVFSDLKGFFASAGSSAEHDMIDAASVPPRVFVSYTASSPQHQHWVTELATFLRANGINARLDRWHLRHGMDVAQWMCNELDQAERVVLICDELYAQKADGRHGGVGWEIRIVQGDLLTRPDSATTAKYLPVICSTEIVDGTPGFLKSVYCLHWPRSADEDDKRRELLEALYDVGPTAPPIGPPPIFIGRATTG
jgi:hypothetical protein